ncbi:restriction endonuclease subunit S [Oceanospirillum sediminis]|uniref:Restriction endonuclease subunit S n=1 Tax=Oceanospirillum sediminis TaxID=2760088 RepID=A0A839INQ4_9GAMM|nr:restriction endonuclease subunit S [Oceanospirillum sediminis]MBB1486521.1 restriction endonuclease subunit S [Oceanospirillum sediminis]
MTDKQTVKFGDICREVKLTTKDPIADGYERYIGLEHLDSGSLKIKRWGLIAEDKPSFTRVFKKGQILFGKRRPYLKKAAVAEFDGICSGDIIVMEPIRFSYDPSLIPYIVQSNIFWDAAIKSSSGSLSPRTKFKSLSNIEITLHEKEFIHRKKSVLLMTERASSHARDVCLAGEKLSFVLKKELLVGSWSNEKKKQANCGLIPESWEEERFDLIGKFLSGGTPKKSNESYWKGNFPWFSPKDMKTFNLENSIDRVTKEGALSGSKIIPEQTILFVVRGMILAHTFPVGITNQESSFNQDMKAIQVNDEFDPLFILHWMIANSSNFLSLVSTSTHGTKRLSSDAFSSLWVPKPPKEIQIRLVNSLENFRQLLEGISTREKDLNEIRQNLANQLME